MQTLVITRGERFPLERIQEVLKCRKRGERKMRLLFKPPSVPTRKGLPMTEQDEAEYISQNFGVSLSVALKIVQKKRKKRVDR